MADPVVGIVGMRAFRRDMKTLTDDDRSALYTAIKAAGKEAAEPVAERDRATVPKRTGRLAGSIRTNASRTGATVRMGSKTVPYAGWIDFGGDRPDGSSREYVPDGRYLFPAAQDLASVSASKYAAAMERVFETSGVWTNSTNDPGAVHD